MRHSKYLPVPGNVFSMDRLKDTGTGSPSRRLRRTESGVTWKCSLITMRQKSVTVYRPEASRNHTLFPTASCALKHCVGGYLSVGIDGQVGAIQLLEASSSLGLSNRHSVENRCNLIGDGVAAMIVHVDGGG